MFGMIVTGGFSEYIAGANTINNLSKLNIAPSFALAGAGTWSATVDFAMDGTQIAKGLSNAYLGYSVGTGLGATANSIEKAIGTSGKSNPWDAYTSQIRRESIDVSSWNKGSFNTPEESVAMHYYKHADEVGASSIEQYIRKAEGFMQNLKGATKSYVDGTVDGVVRYKKNGKYIDLAPDGSIISFGTTK